MINNIFNEITVGVGLLFTVILFLFYYKKAKSRQLLSYIPNIWTSLGILGTFVAIVISLDSGNDNNFGDINQLVSDIIPAFQTSIIGIIGAIITSIIVKILFAIEDKKEDDKYRSEVNDNISPELFLNRMHLSLEKNNSLLKDLISITQSQRSEVINEMISQKDTLKEFLNEFVHQLKSFYSEIYDTTSEHAKVMVDGYLHGLKQVVDPMHADIVNHIDGLLAAHTQAINDYMQEEDRNLTKISSGIIAALSANSETLISSIKRVEETELDNIKHITESFNSELSQMSQSLKSYLQEENRELTNISSGIIAALNANSEAVISSVKHVEETESDNIKNITESFNSEMNQILQAFKNNIQEENKELANVSSEIIVALDTNSKAVVSSIKRVEEAELDNIKSITEAFNSEMNQISQSINNHLQEENKKLVDISEGIITALNTNSEVIISSIKCVEETELDNVKSLAGTFNSELKSTTQSFISSLSNTMLQMAEFVDKLPDKLIDFKQGLIEAMRQIIVDKYSLLLEEQHTFSDNVLKKVKKFEEDISQQAKQESTDWLKDVRSELQQMMDVLNKNIQSNANLIEKLIHEMNGDMSTVVSSLSSSSENYNTIVNQIGRFLPSLERGVADAEKGIANLDKTNETIRDLLKTVEEVSLKNQQLRYELMQWRKVHKLVDINFDDKSKECPECHAKNPIDANYCRECLCGFWDYEKIP